MDNNKIINDYLDAISDIPLPTKEQTTRFASYVLNAHSWYKHLPPIPPGRRFIFYIDPNVARTPVYENNILVGFRDAEKSDLSHHADKLTPVYHEKFGHWFYDAPAPIFQSKKPPKIANCRMDDIAIPQQLIEVGTCYLTSWLSDWQPLLYSIPSRFDRKTEIPDGEASDRFVEFCNNCEKRNEVWHRKIVPEMNTEYKEFIQKAKNKKNEYKGLKKLFQRGKMRKELKELFSEYEDMKNKPKDEEFLELEKRVNDYKELEGRLQRQKMMQAINGFLNLVKELKENH